MILIRPLDFEATPAYTLTVSANDEGSPSLAASVPFVINIIDENDNAPIILTAIAQVQENAPVEKPILTLRATDADSGLNGQIKFKIVDQSPTNAFHLKGDKIYAEAALDREAVEQYELLIEASDLGQPALSSQRQITIIVTDQNDNAPRWVGVRAGAVDVSTQSVSKPIALMRAIDDDAGLNGSVGYRLLTRGSDDLFTMTADGQLFLSEPLRNPAPLYRLSVEAMDRTDLSGRSARKVNDFDRRSIEVPFTVIAAMQSSALNFATKEYRFEVAEDAKVGTEIGNVRASGVSGGKVEYFVTDAHSNSSSATGKMEQLTIDVDEKSGQLRVVAPLDRETTQGALFLSVHAVNTGANGPQAAHCTLI
uniref:Cadherin domain-containing protein n=1 Tax=Plectus sambesii TaxID=2011161 RepID=A0A914UWB6_9BILA